MKGYDGYSDREILISIAEKVETLFVFVNDQKMCNAQMDGRIRDLQINGAAVSQQNARDIVRISADVAKINTDGPAVPSKEAILRIVDVETAVEDLKGFKSTCVGKETGEASVTSRQIALISLVVAIVSVIFVGYRAIIGA